VNFEIEVLTNEQIEGFKKSSTTFPKDIVEKLEVLDILLNNKLIAKEEYNVKRKKLLDTL
jgi:hypothetical protein